AIATVADNAITWEDSGTSAPTGSKVSAWLANQPHCLGDIITDPYNGHFYTAVVAGPPPIPPANTPCATTSGPQPTDPFPLNPPVFLSESTTFQVNDGSLSWELFASVGTRQPNHWYDKSQAVRDAATNQYYSVGQDGISSTSAGSPFPGLKDGEVTWQLVTPSP